MSKKLVLALAVVGLSVAACAKKPEPVVETVTVTPEPVFQGKYGAN